VLRDLTARSDVIFAEPVVLRWSLATPADALYPTHQWALPLIRADEAWEVTTGDSSIRVAVIDSGFDVGHQDAPANLELGCDFVRWTNTNEACPAVSRDGDGHGTHVARIIAARWNNVGIAGLAPNVILYVVRTADDQGASSSVAVADAIVAAADAGARMINLSLGGTSTSAYEATAVAYAVNAGSLLVVSAGNCGVVSSACPTANPVFYPAAYSLTYPDAVLAVGATNYLDQRADYSNQGSYLSLVAPGGSGVSSALLEWVTSLGLRGTSTLYASHVGTSQAAPHVDAAAGLALSVRSEIPRA